jgi:hypothetical protein
MLVFFGHSAFKSIEESDQKVAHLNYGNLSEIETVNTREGTLPICQLPIYANDKLGQLKPDSLTIGPQNSTQIISLRARPLSPSNQFLFRYNHLNAEILDLVWVDAGQHLSRRFFAAQDISSDCDCNEDDVAPIITIAKEITLPCGLSRMPSTTGFPQIEDACSQVEVTWADQQLPGGNSESLIQRTWVAIDGCGNRSKVRQSIRVQGGCTEDLVQSHFDPKYYPSHQRTWRDSGYYFIPELVEFQVRRWGVTPSGTAGIKVDFAGSDASGLRYNGKALFLIDKSNLPSDFDVGQGSAGQATLLISEELLLCPSPAQEVGLGQNDPYFPLLLSGKLISIDGNALSSEIPIAVQLNDFRVR